MLAKERERERKPDNLAPLSPSPTTKEREEEEDVARGLMRAVSEVYKFNYRRYVYMYTCATLASLYQEVILALYSACSITCDASNEGKGMGNGADLLGDSGR